MPVKIKRLSLISIFIIVFTAGMIFAFFSGILPAKQESSVNSNTTEESTPELEQGSTTVAFAELTIPYLREQNFSSRLGEREQYAVNNQYTSYLTSYQSDGLKINGLLTIPNGDQPPGGWPAIVFVHGYIPPGQYRTTEKYEDYVDYLAKNEFVVFKIDLRGHGSSEGLASGAYYSGDYIIDTLNAYSALENADFVDAGKIGLWGHSMGGNVVLRALAAKPEIPAAVIWAGSVYTYEDFQDFGISDASYRRPDSSSPRRDRRENLFDTHGRFDPESPFWKQVVPTNYLGDLTGAIQLHHAVNDNVVDIAYSRNLVGMLEQAGIINQLFEYQAGGHNINGSSFVEAMSRTERFYDENL